MTLIVLAAICLIACGFFLFVLIQWTRDAGRKTITRTAVDDAAGRTNEKKLHIVGPRRNIEVPDSASGSSCWSLVSEDVRAVADLDAASANGLLTRKSPGR